MIDWPVLFATLVAMFLMVLLLLGVVYSRIHWLAKGFLITISVVASALTFYSYRAMQGWPVSDSAPEKMMLVGAFVEEPDPALATPGAIYLWYKDYRHPDPRAIRLPYSKDLHRQMNKAQAAIGAGKPVHMAAKKATERKGKPGSPASTYDDDESPIDFVPPPSTLPDKGE